MKFKTKDIIKRITLYMAVILIVIYTLLPIFWLFISSITTNKELLAKPPHWIPQSPTLFRYQSIITGGRLAAWMAEVAAPSKMFRNSLVNSFIIASITTVISLFFGTLSAYAFARLRFRFKKVFYIMAIAVQMLPQVAIVIPLYFIMKRLNLIDKHAGMILAYCSFTLTYVIWIMSGFFQSLPRELEESARIDGCTRVGTLFRVMIPIALPGLVSTGILSFLTAWNEFMYGLIFTNRIAKTMPVAVGEFSTQFSVDYGMMTAGGFLACIPPVLLAMFFQKYIIRGLTSGSVKG